MNAQVYVADMYAFGFGVAKDEHVLFLYEEKAAKQGYAKAQFNTGICYWDGLGCEQSFLS